MWKKREISREETRKSAFIYPSKKSLIKKKVNAFGKKAGEKGLNQRYKGKVRL